MSYATVEPRLKEENLQGHNFVEAINVLSCEYQNLNDEALSRELERIGKAHNRDREKLSELLEFI